MKKIMLCLCVLLLLGGCATNKTAESEEVIERTIDVPETPAFGEETINSDLERKIETTAEYEGISRSADLSKDNSQLTQIVNTVKSILYSEIPADAYYPPVKNIIGEWVFCSIGDYNSIGADFNELGFADFSIDYDKPALELVLHPRIANIDGDVFEEDDASTGYLPFSGGQEANGSFRLYDGDSLFIILNEYYIYDAYEYVVAELWVGEGAYVDVLFFREVAQ